MTTRRMRGWAIVWFATLIPLTASCGGGDEDGGTGPVVPVPAQLQILTSNPVVAAGDKVSLSARVLDQTGAVMPGAAISWISEDVSTATVEAATGIVQGVAGGEVRIVAEAGAFRDSVQALVTWMVASGQTRVRLRAGPDVVSDLQDVHGWSFYGDRLGTDAGDFSLLSSSMNGELFDPGSVLSVYLPGRPATGKAVFSTVDPAAFLDPENYTEIQVPLMVFETGMGSNQHFAWVSNSGWILRESMRLEPAGQRRGELRGRLMANVTGYSVAWDETDNPLLTPLGRTGTLYAEISAAFYHRALPVVSLTFSGGPFPGHIGVDYAAYTEFGSPWDGGQLLFELEPGGTAWGDLSVVARRDPEVGTWPISPWDPMGPNVAYSASVSFSIESLDWLSESGELRIDAATPPPAPDLTGELRGIFAIDFLAWSPGSAPPASTGQQMGMTGTFHVPWWSSPAEALSMRASHASWIAPRLQQAANVPRIRAR